MQARGACMMQYGSSGRLTEESGRGWLQRQRMINRTSIFGADPDGMLRSGLWQVMGPHQPAIARKNKDSIKGYD